ncbi:extensin family protein [Rhodopseudomonas palustris]|uniref:Extensin-like n=1 Tax=Rhodopseudomonas palustris (strain BisB18) TaxID=316056 RepID=Q216F4_RHOPB
MTRGVRLYLVGSFVLVAMAGCGRYQAEREPWRAEAEIACLKSGAVKETQDLVRIDPISGPGVCGAEFPLKVTALGESAGLGFADDLRPPGSIGGDQPRWPVNQARSAPSSYPVTSAPQSQYPSSAGPMTLNPPGLAQPAEDIDLPPDGAPQGAYQATEPPRYRPVGAASSGYSADRNAAPALPQDYSQPRLGPGPGDLTGAVGPVALKPVATLACPIVSALDKWLAEAVQPAAQRWFGVRVVEIKQISAYSCRGMNGNSRAHISEHAFGNALDIAAFTLADGRRISVKDGWKGLPEEQGFLRDVHASACQVFNTVLSPGSNVFHYDHIHVDLMRRSSRRIICQPAAVSGEEVAARVQQRNPYATNSPAITGSLGAHKVPPRHKPAGDDDYEDE